MRLAVRLTPRGGRDRIEGWGEDEIGRRYLKVRVSAPPVEGEANAALGALLAKALKIPRSRVRVAAGQTARLKQVELEGIEAQDIARAFDPPTVP